MTKGPLAGLRIAVTRPAAQADELARPLRAAGAQVVLAPLIRVAAAPVTGELLQAAQHVADYDWVIFSSVNGVELFSAAVRQAGRSTDLQQPRIACVGPATAAAARAAGLRVAAMPDEFVGDAIAAALQQQGAVQGARVLLARAGGARTVLPQQLRAAGALVDDVAVYRSVADELGTGELRRALAHDGVDVLTFTSGSAVRYFAEYVGSPGHATIAVIGPITADTARELALPVAIEAEPHTIAGLVTAVVEYFSTEARLRRKNEHR